MKKFLTILLFTFYFSCSSLNMSQPHSFKYKGKIKPGKWLRYIKIPYTAGEKEFFVKMQIYFPKNYKKNVNFRTIILLPGYNFNIRDWEISTNIEKYANEYNIILVCPDMRKTLYETKFYPETTNKWTKIPGGIFVGEVLMKYLQQNFSIAYQRNKTGILGISTGARGAILMAEKYPSLFSVASGLSGDYDPLSMKRDKLLTSFYGPYKKFKDRWANDDNILKLSKKLKHTSVFLSHGGKDFVVPKQQSILLAMRLKSYQKRYGGFEIQYNEKKYSLHDWRYWRKILPEVMAFFNEKLSK